MIIKVNRLRDNGNSTIGTMDIDGKFEGFTLEDTFNEPKVYGQTRIPEGTYEIKLRTVGGMNERYGKKYGDSHRGMLWLQDVPGFEWVYLHTGNKHEDTDGCILVGTTCDSSKSRQTVAGSVLKYINVYNKVMIAFDKGEKVTIEIV